MKIPVLPAVVLLSLLTLHSVQGAALGSPKEETTIGNYEEGSEAFNTQFLNLDKLQSVFKGDEFLNWHAITEEATVCLGTARRIVNQRKLDGIATFYFLKAFKKAFPFFNWEAFPKLKGLRSATPDAQ